jgi:hypothetical protein
MGEDFGAGIGLAHLGDVGGGEALVHLAAALPGDDA